MEHGKNDQHPKVKMEEYHISNWYDIGSDGVWNHDGLGITIWWDKKPKKNAT